MRLNLHFISKPRSALRRWWSDWIFNRKKSSDTHPLTLHNVYVLPTRAGWMMLVTTAVLMLATINYQLNLGYLLIFLLTGAGTIGLHTAHRAMTRLVLRLNTAQALVGTVHENIEVVVDIFDQRQNEQPHHSETLTLQYDFAGIHPLPLLSCETRYPLGLLRLWSVWRIQSSVLIEARPLIQSEAAPNLTQPAPDPTKDDFRAYRLGDAPRNLLWKTVAKRPDSPDSWGVRDRDPNPHHEGTGVPESLPPRQSTHTDIRHPQDETLARLRSDQLLLSVLLLVCLPFFLHLALWYPILACALVGIRLWLTTTAKAQAPKWLQLPLIAGLLTLIWLQFGTFNGIEPSVSACLGLLGIKALELPSHHRTSGFSRDRWVVVFLALFTLAAHFLVSQSLLSSLLVVVGLLGLLYVLVDAHGNGPWRIKLKSTATLVLLGVPVMLALFLLFPRFPPLWSLQTQETKALTGLSNTMQVGEIGKITLDNRIILRLELETSPESPRKIVSQAIYLRGPILTEFDGKTWHTYQRSQITSPVVLDDIQEPSFGYTKIEDGRRTRLTTSPGLRNTPLSISPNYLRMALNLPSQNNPRTRQWVQRLRDDPQLKNASPSQLSDYWLSLLRTGGYRYSLEPGTYGAHSTDELLFDRKLGFCEHYAASYVIAMRMLGVPAQVVTGYQGAEATQDPNLFVVRNRHAHAWAEYWDSQQGWVRVDPTAVVAPARLQNSEAFNQAPEQLAQRNGRVWGSPILAPMVMQLWKARQQWDAGSYAWEQWMQSFNQESQMAWLKKLGVSDPSWRDLVQLLDGALIFLLCAGAAIYAVSGRRSRNDWLILLQEARMKASSLGARLGPNATPKDIAKALPADLPQRKEAQSWLLQLEQYQYQSQYPQRLAIGEQKKLLATLKRTMKTVFQSAR